MGLGADVPVEGDAHRVVAGVYPGLTEVGHVRFGSGLEIGHQSAEFLEGDEILGFVGEKAIGVRQVAGEQERHCFATDGTTALNDGVVGAAFDLEENGGSRVVVVKPEAKFVAVFITVNSVPGEAKVRRIEVNTMIGVREVRLADAIFVKHQVRTNKVPHPEGDALVHTILQLETLRLQLIFRHDLTD
jgi:hypothetical protein